MADNVEIDNGSLADFTAATDDDGTAHHPYVKLEFGGDGTQTKVTSTTGLPVNPTQETAGVGVGAAADAEATGNGSVIAILKRLRTLLAGGLPAALSSGGGVKVGVVPGTSGGLSTHHLVSAANTNPTSIKTSAGQVFGWYIYNNATAARKVAFHDTAGAPTAGASIKFAIVIPVGGAANVFSETGIEFTAGIAITMVTGMADTDATAVSANDLNSNIFYK